MAQTQYAQDYFWNSASQTVNLASLNSTSLKSLPIPIAPVNEQKRILDRINDLLKCAHTIELSTEKSRRHAEKIKQSILAKAFRGELVEQDPNDPPASELLEAIKKDKAIPLKKKGAGERKGTSAGR